MGLVVIILSADQRRETGVRSERKTTKLPETSFSRFNGSHARGLHTHTRRPTKKKKDATAAVDFPFFFLFVFHEENDEKAARRTHIFGSVITPSATTLSSGQNKTWNSTSLRPHKLRMWSIALGPNAKRIDDVKKSWPSPRRSVFTIQWH